MKDKAASCFVYFVEMILKKYSLASTYRSNLSSLKQYPEQYRQRQREWKVKQRYNLSRTVHVSAPSPVTPLKFCDISVKKNTILLISFLHWYQGLGTFHHEHVNTISWRHFSNRQRKCNNWFPRPSFTLLRVCAWLLGLNLMRQLVGDG